MAELFRIKLHNDPNFKLKDLDTSLIEIDKQGKTLILCNKFNIPICRIASKEIQNYCMSILPEYLQNSNLKLSDVDTDSFEINTKNKTLTYRDNTIDIMKIQSSEIRNYCIKQVPECFLTCFEIGNKFKLSDFDKDLFKINKENETVTYKNININIKNILSEEIKTFLISNMNFNEKEKTQYLLNLIMPPLNRPPEYEMHIQVKFDIDMFNSLENKNKLYFIKYIFSTWNTSSNKIKNLLEIITNLSKNKNNLLHLINNIIKTNDITQIEYILQNKSIKLNEEDYDKLQEFALSLRLFDIVKILIKFQTIDSILQIE